MLTNNKYLIVIAGPTAVGKTKTAIEIAQKFNCEIVSADSRQIYKELIIGSAQPNAEELAKVKHHFIGTKSITEYYNVSMFEIDVITLLNNLFVNNDFVVLCGGSGLYIDAVCKGIDDMPNYEPELRAKLTQQANNEGIENLRILLKKLDPETYKKIDLRNKNRIIRAVEMCIITGKPYSELLTKRNKIRNFNVISVALNIERAELHNKINERTDIMVNLGLVNEAKQLYQFKNQNALNTVGYKELFDYLENKYDLNTAIELIKRNTRRYARKQISWFNRNNQYTWFKPTQVSEIINFINNIKNNKSGC